MIRLSSPDLPTIPQRFPGRGPAIRLKSIADPDIRPPFLRINAFAQYGDRPGFDVTTESMPPPLHVGRLHQVVFSGAGVTGGHRVLDVANVVIGAQPFAIARTTEQLHQPVPGLTWADQLRINVYSSDQSSPAFPASAGDTISARISLQAQAPIPDASDNFTLDLSSFTGSNTFVVTRVVAEGLIFTDADNPSSPQTGEFKQDGTTLVLYGSETYAPRVLRPLVLEGQWSATLPDPLAVLATFDISSSAIAYLDEVDYLSCAFRPIKDRYQPQTAEFFGTRHLITLVVSMTKGAWLKVVTSTRTYTSTLADVSSFTTV